MIGFGGLLDMPMERIYLDWNATAPLLPVARSAMLAALDRIGNPSSVHGEGRAARRLVETARQQVAALVGADPRNVIFTSGGTEANALALSPAIERRANRAPLDCLLVSAIEHPSVRCGGRFPIDKVEEASAPPGGVVILPPPDRPLSDLKPGGVSPFSPVIHPKNEPGVGQRV